MMDNSFTPDSDEIFSAIINANVSAVAREEGASLAQAWIDQCSAIDAEDETIATECSFYLEIAKNTYVVGTLDRIARDEDGIFGCEWKSTAKRSPARGSFGGWNESRWFDSIAESHQVPTYAAALFWGTFVDPEVQNKIWGDQTTAFAKNFPIPYSQRILVRAVSKCAVPEIWPTPRGAFVTIDGKRIEATLNAYRVTAEQIRASKRSGLTPWALPDSQKCIRYSKYKCSHYDSCRRFVPGNVGETVVGSFSPGSQVAVNAVLALYAQNDKNVLDDNNDSCKDDLVILSASTLGNYAQCSEKYRRDSMSSSHEASDAQETGTVLHAALSNLYDQQMRRK